MGGVGGWVAAEELWSSATVEAPVAEGRIPLLSEAKGVAGAAEVTVEVVVLEIVAALVEGLLCFRGNSRTVRTCEGGAAR